MLLLIAQTPQRETAIDTSVARLHAGIEHAAAELHHVQSPVLVPPHDVALIDTPAALVQTARKLSDRIA